MKVTFPYMGTTLIYKKFVELLGHEPISPPKPSRRTIELGVKYSPEFACFPMKVIMGSYIEAIEKGAEVILTSGGHGPCRAGFYGEMHKRILKNIGYDDVDIIVFDSIKRDYKTFLNNVQKLKSQNSWWNLGKYGLLVYKMINALDALEKQIQIKRAYEINKGDCTRVWDEIQRIYQKVYTLIDLKKANEKGQQLIEGISTKEVVEEERIRIGIVGEIYVVMESSINMKMEELLGDLGCEVSRSHYLSHWIDHNMIPKLFRHSNEEGISKKGERYIEVPIGGHAQETMGHIIDYNQQGFDGIIHLMPFGCLPELVCQSIMPQVIQDLDMPVLTIALDEQTGIANNLTRIEAFLDLIKNKKRRKRNTAC